MTVVYHYCSNLAFCSIMKQKRLRLSLLSMSNDAKEGQHILDVASRCLPNDFTHKDDFLEQLKQIISLVSAIGFCASADGDLLSQWRGYADEARGMAIGFDRDALAAAAKAESDDDLIVRLAPILYGDIYQDDLMSTDLNPIIQHYNSGNMRRPGFATLLTCITEEEREADRLRYDKANSDLFLMLMKIVNYSYMVKSPFFAEENEWRIHVLLTAHNNNLDLPNAQFYPSADKIKPFRDFPLKGFAPAMVKEVVLGPRNQTPIEVARLFLNSQGFEHVTLRQSKGSYR